METIGGCTVLRTAGEPTTFGPAETAGAYSVIAGPIPPHTEGPPVHLHPHTDEAFYVAAGEATFTLDGEELLAVAGDFVLVPRGTPHTVANPGDVPVLGIILISPGDAEHEFVPVEPA
jgi:mannose-6-phosphate isomerase-like protein (cupin superfamily)